MLFLLRYFLAVALYVENRKEKPDVTHPYRSEFILVDAEDEIRLAAALAHLKQICCAEVCPAVHCSVFRRDFFQKLLFGRIAHRHKDDPDDDDYSGSNDSL